MANTFGFYKPEFYANEALIWLQKALVMGKRVYMGFDAERRAFDQGDTINIKRPMKLAVNNAPSTAQDLIPGKVQMTLSQWKEVKFQLTDQDLAYTGPDSSNRVIRDHIGPAAYALAEQIDTDLQGLFLDVPWTSPYTMSSATITTITGMRKILKDNLCPPASSADMSYVMGTTTYGSYLANSAFSQWQGSDGAGVAAQASGVLSQKYGFEVLETQNVNAAGVADANAAGSLTTIGSATATGAQAANSLTFAFTTGTVTNAAALPKGQAFTIAHGGTVGTRRYAVTVTSSAVATTTLITVSISPPLRTAVAGGEVVALVNTTNTTSGVHTEECAFHRNAFGLAFARLPDQIIRDGMGAQVASVQDPQTGLAVRSRMFYIGDTSKVVVALDVLYGVRTLDPDLAVCGIGT